MSEENSVGLNMGRARTEDQRSVMQKIIDDNVCPFCWENFEKYHPKPVIFKTNKWLVTENAWPYELSKNHILCVYKDHVEHTSKINEEGWKEIGEIIKKLEEERGIGYGTMLMRFGNVKNTGATVPHLHFQLIQSDKDHKDYEPEKGLWTRIG